MDFLYKNDDLAVLNKAAGVSLLKDRSGAECLWDTLPEVLGCKPYLLHRLDKPTSGVLLIALNQGTQSRLTRLFSERRVRKYYLAWVSGRPPGRGFINLPLKKGRKNRYRVAGQRAGIKLEGGVWTHPTPDPEGHPSQTRFRLLHTDQGRSLLLLQPLTGRTHQLRVHLAWIGHPIIGDAIYGRPESASQQANRLCLHSHRLMLGKDGSFSAPLGVDWPD